MKKKNGVSASPFPSILQGYKGSSHFDNKNLGVQKHANKQTHKQQLKQRKKWDPSKLSSQRLGSPFVGENGSSFGGVSSLYEHSCTTTLGWHPTMK